VDTGIGISESEQERIFERFEQASTDTTRKYGGSGLGLSIIRNLLKIQGADINVTSEPGIGSEFFFSLKFGIIVNTTASHQKKSDPAKDGLTEKANVNVLLVEDNEMNMKVAKRFLERWDYVVDTAENGLEALKKYKSAPYDMILMDLHMPEMDGWEATKAIRNKEKNLSRKIPIIALTADVMIDDLNKLYESGINDYITKPFSAAELQSKIEKLLNQ
jgi:CheY-like chemotaxis protein